MLVIVIVCMLFVSLEALDSRMSTEEYNKKFSFNSTLDKKMVNYHDFKMSWFKFYMNICLPYIAYLGAKASYDSYMLYDWKSPQFLLATAFGVCMVLNAILFRYIDALSYYLNIIAIVIFVAYKTLQVALSLGVLTLFDLTPFIAWILIAAWNINYFRKKEELFLKSEKELRALYSLDD